MLPPVWLALHGHLLWWAALALALVTGWLLERAARRWRGRRAWRARAGSLPHASGEAQTDLPVRLSGTLRVEGEPARRFEDGEPAAIASAAAGPRVDQDAESVSVRAARVWLHTEHGAIELRGPIDVVGGRTVRTTGAPSDLAWSRLSAALGDQPDWAFTSLPVELRSVASGDRVEVAGTLERALDGDGSDYRSTMRRVMVPSAASILVQLAAPVPARSWRGPLALLVVFGIANAALVRMPEPWADRASVLAYVSPFTRSRAIGNLQRRTYLDAHAALSGSPALRLEELELALAIAPYLDCAERARLRRASDDADGALREVERCEGLYAARERTLALFALGREEQAMASWRELLRAADAVCASKPSCDGAVEIATSRRLEWNAAYPSRAPRDLLLGHGHVDRPHLAHRLVEALSPMDLRSASMRRARARWMLDLAMFELELDQLDRAGELLEGVSSHLATDELEARWANALRRDADHLRIVVAVRRGELGEAQLLVHTRHDHAPCKMGDIVHIIADPITSDSDRESSASAGYHRVRDFFVAREAAEPRGLSIRDRETLAWIDHFARAARPPNIEHLRASLPAPRTCGRDAHDQRDAAWDALLARAHDALGDADQAAAIRGCVRGARARLLAPPPLERYP